MQAQCAPPPEQIRLSDPQFVIECNKTICNTIIEYSNTDCNLQESDTAVNLPSMLLIDMVLIKSRETAIRFKYKLGT